MTFRSKQLISLLTFMFLICHFIVGQEQFGGLALYTLREDMSKNPVETLKKVSETGYAYVEAAGYKDGMYYGMKPEDFKKTLEDAGLRPMSTHQPTVTLENADQLITDAKAAGFKYFVIPVPPQGHYTRDPETRKRHMDQDLAPLVELLDAIGKKCDDAGLKLLYHNHDFEYEKNKQGIIPIEFMLENCDPKYVNFQMDLYWVTKAGADPISYFKKYPGRFKSWHVKDMDEDGKFAPVGTGTINFKSILGEKELSGMEFYMVEQDKTFETEPLEAIKISREGLVNLGFK